jgi:3-oxoacyl-[acyl-carrier protein] reductase
MARPEYNRPGAPPLLGNGARSVPISRREHEEVAPMSDLTDQVIAITGAAGGIGRAHARKLAGAGATVVLGDLNGPSVEALAEEINARGGAAIPVQVDVSDERQVAAFIDRATRVRDRIDALVNNAGVISSSPLDQLPLEEWTRILNTNLTSAFLCTKAVLKVMIPRGRGVIVNTSSEIAWRGRAGYAHYAASKAGLIGFTRCLALELGGHGIRINAVAPGIVDTPMPRTTMSEADLAAAGQQNALGRMAQPDDIAEAVYYLVSDSGRHITGQMLHVNGGDYFA